MIFHRSLSKKKGAAYSFFSGLSAGFVPAVLLLLLQTFVMAAMPLFEFINRDFGTASKKSKELYDYFIYGTNETVLLYFILAISGLLAILTAVRLFSFICDKRTVNVFYSLGIKRSTLFLSKYASGTVLLIAASIVPVVLSYIVNLIFLGPSWRMSLMLLHFYCGLSVFALVCFSVAAAVFSSVGTVSEAIVYSVALLFAPTVIIFIIDNIAGALLTSSTLNVYVEHFTDSEHTYNSTTSLLQATSDYNPLLFFTNQLQNFSVAVFDNGSVILQTGIEEAPWHLPALFVSLPWFIIAVALGASGALLFRRIKAENCGFLNTNKVLSNLTIFELCLVGSAVMLGEIRYTEPVVVIGAGVIVAFILYLIAEIFLKRNFIKILKTLYKFVAHMTVIGIIFGICATDAFNYSSYIPDRSRIESVEISAPVSYALISNKQSGQGWNSEAFIRIMEAYHHVFMPVITTPAEIDKVIEINNKITDTEKDEGIRSEIVIRYNLKNGKASERRHVLTSTEEITALLGLFDLSDVKKEITKLFYNSDDIEDIKKSYEQNGWLDDEMLRSLAFDYEYSEITARTVSLHESKVLKLSGEQWTRLRDAVCTDLMLLSSAQYFTGNSRQIGILSFGLNEKAYSSDELNDYLDDIPVEEMSGYTDEAYTVPDEAVTEAVPDEEASADSIQTEDITGESIISEDVYYDDIFGDDIFSGEIYNEDVTYEYAVYPDKTDEAVYYDETIPEEDAPYTSSDLTPYEGLGGMQYSLSYDVIITEDMINTITFLNNEGFADCFTSTAEIESVSFREYKADEIFSYYYYTSDNYIHDFFAYPVSEEYFSGISSDPDFNPVGVVSENVITDPTLLKELDSLMRLHEYTFDSGYFCLVKYKDGTYITKYLSCEDAPHYVKNHSYTLNLNPLY